MIARNHRIWVGLAVLVCLASQLWLWDWFVEDAAISFAYARNWADGWGLVRFPGDERIEGYSNFAWVALMTLFERFGMSGFWSSKLMALGLTAVTVPVLAAFVRGRDDEGRTWGVVAAWLLAVDAAFVIWSASGLENSLFCASLALGIGLTVRESEEGGPPWSAAAWLVLALTRPEGIAYAALGGAWALLLELTGRRRMGRIAVWLAIFWLPFLCYHVVRYQYFAFAFPATYYAKLGEMPFRPLTWSSRTWSYVADYGVETLRFYALPVFLAAVIGLQRWRLWVVAGLCAWLAIVLLYPGVEPFREWGWLPQIRLTALWTQVRVGSIAAVICVTTILGFAHVDWRRRMYCWLVVLLGLGFCMRSGGDWMRGYRWFSLIAVPVAGLAAFGLREIAERLSGGTLRPMGLTGLAALLVAPQVVYQATYRPETTPYSVNKRVKHYRWAMERLQIERADILDHDMGAMLYWGDSLGIVRDSRGLIDIPFALHRLQTPFVREYVFDDYPFELAHGHASTGQAMNRQRRRWTDRYVEFPGYGGKTIHTANFFRRDLMMRPWDGDTVHAASFRGGASVDLLGFSIPSPEISVGTAFYLEFGLRVNDTNKVPIQMHVFLHDKGKVQSVHQVPLGLEDWIPVETWRNDEVFYGKVAIPFKTKLAKGSYGVGVVFTGPHGVVELQNASKDAVYARGEKLLEDVVINIVSRKSMKRAANRDVKRAIAAAKKGSCDGAARHWRNARAHRIRSKEWQEEHRPPVAVAIGRCFARRASGQERAEAVDSIRSARNWAPRDVKVLDAGRQLAEPWMVEGDTARLDGDADKAFELYRDVMVADPSRSWARRYAEEARVERLRLRY